jgi:hypothetical protein
MEAGVRHRASCRLRQKGRARLQARLPLKLPQQISHWCWLQEPQPSAAICHPTTCPAAFVSHRCCRMTPQHLHDAFISPRIFHWTMQGAYQVQIRACRCNIGVEAGSSAVQLDDGVRNPLHSAQLVRFHPIMNMFTLMLTWHRCAAQHAVQASICGSGLAEDTAGQMPRFWRRCTIVQAASSRLTRA